MSVSGNASCFCAMLENTLNKLGSQAEVSEGIIYLNAYQKLFEREKVAEGVVYGLSKNIENTQYI